MTVRPLVMLVALALGGPILAQERDPILAVFRIQAEVEKRLLAADLANLERIQTQMRGATDRLLRLGDDLLRAQKDDEDVARFTARSADLRRAESEVADLAAAAQQVRGSIGARRGYLEQVQVEIKRLEGEEGEGPADELTGRWTVAIEPGGFKGTFDLRLDGTIVTGVYQLSGGWKGSLRGTYVGGNVRLDRIDTQQGFVATYDGHLVSKGDERRLEGTWDATNLAAGMPGKGNWVARKESRPAGS